MTASISVVLVNHNLREELVHALESLTRQRRRPDEVIVVDNASRDGTVAVLRDRFPWVRIISLQQNVGYSQANNLGFAQAHGDYVALLNSDATAEEGWLEELAAALDANPFAAASVPKIYRAGAERTIEQAGAEFNNLGHCWTRGFNQVDRGQLDEPGEVPVLTGCSVLLRRASLHGEPLFDPSFFLYYEELELSLRLRGRGYSIVYVPSAVVRHKGMRSVSKVSRQPDLFQAYFCNRNRLKIVAKYYPMSVIVPNLPLILLSVLYWDGVFARRLGARHAARALAAQLRYALVGLSERSAVADIDASSWLPWMRLHGIGDVLSVRRSLASST